MTCRKFQNGALVVFSVWTLLFYRENWALYRDLGITYKFILLIYNFINICLLWSLTTFRVFLINLIPACWRHLCLKTLETLFYAHYLIYKLEVFTQAITVAILTMDCRSLRGGSHCLVVLCLTSNKMPHVSLPCYCKKFLTSILHKLNV